MAKVLPLSSKALADEFVAGWYLCCFALCGGNIIPGDPLHRRTITNFTCLAAKQEVEEESQAEFLLVHFQAIRDSAMSAYSSYLKPLKNTQPTTQPKSTTSALIPDQFDNTDESWDVDTMPFDDEDVTRSRRAEARATSGMCRVLGVVIFPPTINVKTVLASISTVHPVSRLHTNSIHSIDCSCSDAVTHIQQLLRISWFPSTTANPKMAATFHLLEEFHILSFESKVSAYKFYNALTQRTDNTSLAPVKVKHWMYALFVAINANLRLKRKVVSNNIMDPSLSCSWTYFVEAGYKEFLAEKIDIVQEKFTCSSHTAVNMADMKTNRGLAATGLGTIDCAHHNMKQPNAVRDLQKDEKYINMDYLFFLTLCHLSLQTLNISYDIACQWHKKLWQCMSMFPTSMQFDHTSRAISFFVPKFHLPVHIEKCQTTFSFNFKRGVGRMDGEAPERGWANINPIASSTKEMGPGARQDTLDDFFGNWNWKKVVSLGTTMQRKLKDAVPQCADHQSALNDLEEGLKEEYGEVLEQWRLQVEAWENDQSQLNPFERNSDGM
ncbi:hypothetical protein EDB19DRAFT_1835614 [Suillus lakei]|nr:hypothetical protein EDB19DRAFT_1835614 [Suillus lakei]